MSIHEMENKEEPYYWSEMNLHDIDLEFDADEARSPEENIKKCFDKIKFMKNSAK